MLCFLLGPLCVPIVWSPAFHISTVKLSTSLRSVSIGIALYAAYLSRLPANRHFTYGYGRYEVLSGFTNGILLICVAVYIFVEARASPLFQQNRPPKSLHVCCSTCKPLENCC